MILAENGVAELQGYSEELLTEFGAVAEKLADYFFLAGMPAASITDRLYDALLSAVETSTNRRPAVDSKRGFYIDSTNRSEKTVAPVETDRRASGRVLYIDSERIDSLATKKFGSFANADASAGVAHGTFSRVIRNGAGKSENIRKIADTLGVPMESLYRNGGIK